MAKRPAKEKTTETVNVEGQIVASPDLVLIELKQNPTDITDSTSFKNEVTVSAYVIENDEENIWGVITHFTLVQNAGDEVRAQITADYIFTLETTDETAEKHKIKHFSEILIANSVWPLFSTIVGAISGQTFPSIQAPPKRLFSQDVRWARDYEDLASIDKLV